MEDRARFEGVGGQKQASASNCSVNKVNCRTAGRTDLQSQDTWTGGWEVATRQRGMLRIYGPLYASGAGSLGTGWQIRTQWDHGRAACGARVVRTGAGGGGD